MSKHHCSFFGLKRSIDPAFYWERVLTRRAWRKLDCGKICGNLRFTGYPSPYRSIEIMELEENLEII